MLKRKYKTPNNLKFRIQKRLRRFSVDFFTLPLKLLVSSGDFAGTKKKMKYLNVPLLCNEMTNKPEKSKTEMTNLRSRLTEPCVSSLPLNLPYSSTTLPARLVDLVNGY